MRHYLGTLYIFIFPSIYFYFQVFFISICADIEPANTEGWLY